MGFPVKLTWLHSASRLCYLALRHYDILNHSNPPSSFVFVNEYDTSIFLMRWLSGFNEEDIYILSLMANIFNPYSINEN